MWSRLPGVVAMVVALDAASISGAAAQSKPTLDYDYFKSRVEPIFLKKRPTHTRCYVCHEGSGNAFKLEKLPEGQKTWSEEQSRRNFETVSKLVTPGDPDTSRLLMQPLAPEGGGNVFHSGGRQFASKQDPDYRAIAQWISGAKPAARPKK
jgi:hypothetical protein